MMHIKPDAINTNRKILTMKVTWIIDYCHIWSRHPNWWRASKLNSFNKIQHNKNDHLWPFYLILKIQLKTHSLHSKNYMKSSVSLIVQSWWLKDIRFVKIYSKCIQFCFCFFLTKRKRIEILRPFNWFLHKIQYEY